MEMLGMSSRGINGRNLLHSFLYMAYNFTPFKVETKKIEEWLGQEYIGIHTGRATPAVLDKVQVEAYGTKQSVSHVAAIAIADARTLMITPWDKTVLKDIEKAVVSSGLGLGVSATGDGVRVSFPELTAERRSALAKVVRAKLEDARVSLRREREAVWEDIQKKEKDGAISEDDKFRSKEELQKIVDDTNKKLEETAERKEKEIIG